MADKETTSFPAMGGDPISNGLFNDRAGSAASSPYTTTEPKKNTQSGDIPGVGTKSQRSATLIHEANGPACSVQATITYPNSPERNKTQRNLRRVAGPGFRNERANQGNTGNV